MGGVLSYFWGPSEDPGLDVVDSNTGLTPREKQAIQKSWALVMQDYKAHGVEIFIIIFKKIPGSQDYFTSFRGKSLETVARSAALRAHASTVMLSLDGIVKNLDDAECLVQLVHKIGKNHHKRGIKRNLFDLVTSVILEYLKSALGEHLDEFGAASWKKTLDVVNTVAEQGVTDDDLNEADT